jgi:hypothetical protein
MPNRIEQKAIRIAKEYLEVRGYTVEDASRNRQVKGYDLMAKREGETLKIEVKGCSPMWGIPDLYVTEFDAERRLVADFLYVVYFIGRKEPKLCIIPKEAIRPEYVVPKHGYRISSRFKNETILKPFLRAL